MNAWPARFFCPAELLRSALRSRARDQAELGVPCSRAHVNVLSIAALNRVKHMAV
jgi:hypothetical protein